MAWPIAEVARMSGVTARTLRHYDETACCHRPGSGPTAAATTRSASYCGCNRSSYSGAGRGLPEIGRSCLSR